MKLLTLPRRHKKSLARHSTARRQLLFYPPSSQDTTTVTAASANRSNKSWESPSASTSSSSSSAASNESLLHQGSHVLLLLPVPRAKKGHTNQMLQLGRRLACHGLRRPTLVTATRYILFTAAMPPPNPFRAAAISDGFSDAACAVRRALDPIRIWSHFTKLDIAVESALD
ncbi:hypothetical protein HU200_048046 [Digitaria exilis]|uniref:Uncharacterized protein n=1 Tax=Digitaria exilis TaxID=1010633 RepID=A0A835AVQ0_9POAL|nr:hypothetical protein HU200_048046 [Digitaria exilis]